jgi:hypothetical protein
VFRARIATATVMGTAFRIVVRQPGADLTPDAGGMVKPCYLYDQNGTWEFAGHSAVAGFTKAVVSGNTLNSPPGPNDIILQAALAINNSPTCNALKTTGAITAAGGLDRTITVNSGGLILGGNVGAWAAGTRVNLDFAGKEAVIWPTTTVSLYNNIGNTGGNGLTFGGNQTVYMVFTNNSYTGTTTINNGQIMTIFDADNSTPGALGPLSNNIMLNGGYLGRWQYSPRYVLSSSRTLTLGPLGGGFRTDSTSVALQLNCKITGVGALYLASRNPFLVTSPDNDYAGGTLINVGTGGSVACASTGKMGRGPVNLVSVAYNGPSSLTLHGNDNLHYTGVPETYLPVQANGFSCAYFKGAAPVMGSLSGDGAVALGAAGVGAFGTNTTLAVGLDNGSSAFYGYISQAGFGTSARVGSLVKGGTGTWSLYGTFGCTGSTTVTNGVLNLMGSVGGACNVGPNGTIGGCGLVKGGLTINGGTFAVELSANTPVLNVTGGLTAKPGSKMVVTLAPGFEPGIQQRTVLTTTTGFATLNNLGMATGGLVYRQVGNNLVVYRPSGTLLVVQ